MDKIPIPPLEEKPKVKFFRKPWEVEKEFYIEERGKPPERRQFVPSLYQLFVHDLSKATTGMSLSGNRLIEIAGFLWKNKDILDQIEYLVRVAREILRTYEQELRTQKRSP